MCVPCWEQWEPAGRKTGVSPALWWSDPTNPPPFSTLNSPPKLWELPLRPHVLRVRSLEREDKSQIRIFGRGTSKAEQDDVERIGGDRTALSHCCLKGMKENLKSRHYSGTNVSLLLVLVGK